MMIRTISYLWYSDATYNNLFQWKCFIEKLEGNIFCFVKVDYNLPTLPQHDSQSAASEVRANTNTEKIVQFRNIFFQYS